MPDDRVQLKILPRTLHIVVRAYHSNVALSSLLALRLPRRLLMLHLKSWVSTRDFRHLDLTRLLTSVHSLVRLVRATHLWMKGHNNHHNPPIIQMTMQATVAILLKRLLPLSLSPHNNNPVTKSQPGRNNKRSKLSKRNLQAKQLLNRVWEGALGLSISIS